MPVSKRNTEPLDSANFEAARDLLQTRLEAGLTQEQVAAIDGSDVRTVARRERNEVHLGPLRQRVILMRVAAKREKK